MVNAAIVLPVLVNVPVLTKVALKLVYVPPVLNVKLVTFTVAADGVAELPVKFNVLKKLPDVIAVPVEPNVSKRFGALAAVPPLNEPN